MTTIPTYRTALTAYGLVLLANFCASAQQLPTAIPEEMGVSSRRVAELSRYMTSLVDEEKIVGGVTMMARRGHVVHFETSGLADRDAMLSMRKDTIFRIASMTKPVISAGVMKLYDRGELGLDDPICEHLEEFANARVLVSTTPCKTKPTKSPTIRQLLAHTGGIVFATSQDKVAPFYQAAKLPTGLSQCPETLSDVVNRLAQLPLAFSPGERWEYGMNTTVLGRLIEVKSGKSLDDFLRTEIFEPLSMRDTHFFLPEEKLDRFAAAYQIDEQGHLIRMKEGTTYLFDGHFPISSDYPYRGPRTYFSPAAGLCSTASDYMRFCLMLLNDGGEILRPQTVDLMFQNQIGELKAAYDHGSRFGLGFAIVAPDEGAPSKAVGTCAWAGIFTTNFCISPQDDWCVITMAQLFFHEDYSIPWAIKYRDLAAEAVCN